MKRVESTINNRQKRDNKVRRFFTQKEKDNPKWKHEAVLEATAERFDKSIRTIKAILYREGIYAD